MLSLLITLGVAAVCIVWLFPYWTIHPIADRRHCRRMISRYKLKSLADYKRHRSDIIADLTRLTSRRYYDYGFKPVRGASDWDNDELHRPQHWRANHRAVVKRILGRIRKKLSRRR